ncbi:MAG TPA: hypothetical protein EYQ70_02830 [Marine Group III euryarchaeote]|uniref:CARDB domain-containing protein n=1 Tax=Marine Group III euryarchaeote TaxID=2173149 RepID=A0A7J4GS26_9ARCH|nr:hypothetical protein [Marine Group III euryarchaeote]
MRKLPLFLLFALVFLALSGQAVSGETFAPVDLYISGPPNGQLKIDEPSGSNVESLTIADGETGQGTFQELGKWTTSSLSADSNISGEWIGNAWVYSSNRDATITIRYTLFQNDESIELFEFSGDVNSGESVQLTGSDEFSLHSLDDSPITLQIESSWSGRGPPPPITEGNTSITFDYGSSSADTKITIPISHLQIIKGDDPTSVTGQNSFFIYVEVYDAFGVDDVLSLDEEDYSMRMGPSDDSPWSATVDKVSKKSDFVEVKFLWSYEGHTLPAGENTYSIEIDATDILSGLDWSKTFQTTIYIEPEPDVEIDPVTSTSKTVDFGKAAVFTLSVKNTGTGMDEFIVTYDNNDGWDTTLDFTEIELEPGDSQNIKLSVTPPDTVSDGQESPTQVTVTASSNSDVSASVTLVTTAREPEPNWDFSIFINKDESEAYDYSSDSFIINDRAPIDVSFSIMNQGNDPNNFNIKAISVESAFSTAFDKSILSSLPQGQMDTIILTLTPREDYFGTNTFVEIEVTSSADSNKETETIEIFLEQSGRIIGNPNLQLKASKGKALNHILSISNTDANEAKRIYFGVSGKEPSDKLAEDWFTFSDRDGGSISYASFLTLLPGKQYEVTITISIPSGVDIGSYDMNIWMYNEIGAQISDQYSIQVVAVQAEESEDTNSILYGVIVLVLGGVLVYGYRNFYLDDGYEDEYDDFDELEVPAIFEELPPLVPEPVVAPVAAPVEELLPPVPEPVVAPVALPPAQISKPRKKWFGLFGKSDDQVQPVVAEPIVAQPVVAEPIVAQPVVAEPIVAQPVVAEPIVAQPVVAEPIVAQPVVAEPVVAQPVVAEPIVAQPVVAEVVTEPVVAQVVVAEVVTEPVVAQVVTVDPVQEDE